MLFVGMVLVLFLADMLLKETVERKENAAFPRELEGTNGKVLLYKNHNAGFPFGALKNKPELVQKIPLAVTSAVAGIFAWLCSGRGHCEDKVAFSLILGGAVSNLYDRLVRGYVVDYFSIQWRFLKKVVFNLGDIFIFLGTGILILSEFIHSFRGE